MKTSSNPAGMVPAGSAEDKKLNVQWNKLDVGSFKSSPIQFPINNSNAINMNASAPTQTETIVPSLFQIAAHFENYCPADSLNQSRLELSQTPFADLMLHPEKLKAALESIQKKISKNTTR